MTKGKLFSLLILFCLSLIISCSEKTPTGSVDTAQLTGYVYQSVNGFFNYISDADITVGTYHTLTDSIGRYSIEIPLGEYSIMAAHEQFDTTITDTIRIRGDRSYFIRMMNGPSYSVSGVVTDTLGAVIEGAVVKLAHLRDTTDINGWYLFQDVLSGQRSITCDYADYFIFTDSFEITNSDISKNINLVRQGYNISGTVSHPVDGLLSGVEVILDDTLYDTTNMNGEYIFENIFIGDHQLRVNSSLYNGQFTDFSLGKSDLTKMFELTKTTIDTLWIEKDAAVKISYSENGYQYVYDNFGDDQYLPLYGSKVEYLLWDSLGQYRVTYYSYERFFMKIDSNINLVNDSIIFVLPFFKENYLRYGDIRLARVAEDWNEITINWENQPSINSEDIVIEMSNEDSPQLTINITNLISLFLNPYGFRVSFVDESCYLCDLGVTFYSSEHPDISKRPHFLLYKTE